MAAIIDNKINIIRKLTSNNMGNCLAVILQYTMMKVNSILETKTPNMLNNGGIFSPHIYSNDLRFWEHICQHEGRTAFEYAKFQYVLYVLWLKKLLISIVMPRPLKNHDLLGCRDLGIIPGGDVFEARTVKVTFAVLPLNAHALSLPQGKSFGQVKRPGFSSSGLV